MDYKAKYEEALERAKTFQEKYGGDYAGFIFPELAESEDERTRKEIIGFIQSQIEDGNSAGWDRWIAWLEKQKDSIPYEKYVEDIAAIHAEARTKYHEGWNDGYEARQVINAVGDSGHQAGYAVAKNEMKPKVATATLDSEKQKEQKPISTEDMPYITDEHFWDREPADSFKYKLAEYMTKCCTKKEGPYGYEYGLSAETILKMAKEELLKRGVVQQPAEWSEEDELTIADLINYFEGDALECSTEEMVQRIKFLRPQPKREWKPSEDEERLINTSISFLKDFADKGYENAIECIDWLKSKLNGNSGK